MSYLYATLIVNGIRTFESIPDKFKEEVRAILISKGYFKEETNT